METRSTRTSVTTREGKIIGTASVTYNGETGSEYELWEGTVERFAPGAFDTHLATGPDVVVTANHDPQHVIARTGAGTARVWADQRGLHYEATPRQTPAMDELRASLEHGDFGGSSLTFKPTSVRWLKDGAKEVRLVERANVYELGPVVSPAYSATSTGVRSEERHQLERERDDYQARLETEKRLARLEAIKEKDARR